MKLWEATKKLFLEESDQLTRVAIPAAGAEPLRPGEGYVSVWLAHGFLAHEVEWLKTRYPAAHVGVRLDVAGQVTTLTRLARPAQGMVGPGVWTNFPITGLVPYRGGSVEIEAGLVALEEESFLGAAVDIVSSFSGLVGPPLSEVLRIAGKVADGVETLIQAGRGEALLALHEGYSAPGGDSDNPLVPGHLAIVRAPEGELEASSLTVKEDRLHVHRGTGEEPLEGYDYLLIRIEGRREREDWRFERFERLIHKAIEAHFAQDENSFQRYRNEVYVAILTSPDLIERDRKQAVLAIRDELDELTEISHRAKAVSTPSLEGIISRHGRPYSHPLLAQDISLRDLLDPR